MSLDQWVRHLSIKLGCFGSSLFIPTLLSMGLFYNCTSNLETNKRLIRLPSGYFAESNDLAKSLFTFKTVNAD